MKALKKVFWFMGDFPFRVGIAIGLIVWTWLTIMEIDFLTGGRLLPLIEAWLK